MLFTVAYLVDAWYAQFFLASVTSKRLLLYAMQAIFTIFSASLFQDFLSMIEDTEFLCVLSDSSERKELNDSKNN